MIVHQAYRFALDPTPRQQGALASHVGGARFAYNWGLELVKRRLEERAAGQDVEVPWTLPTLRRAGNRAKDGVAPWWAENSKEAYSSGLDALASGLRNWADSKQGRRAGVRVGFPRRKRKGHGRSACRFSTGAIRVEADRHHVTLPRLGCLKTHESTVSSPVGWSRGPRGFWRPRSVSRVAAGLCRSPARSNGRSGAPAGQRPVSGWMWGSGTWRCCQAASRSPTPGPLPPTSAGCAA